MALMLSKIDLRQATLIPTTGQQTSEGYDVVAEAQKGGEHI